jgi:hypothetical protein
MRNLRRIVTMALVAAVVALPTAAMALEGETPTDQTTDRVERDTATTDRPVRDLSEVKARALATIAKQHEVLGRLRSAIGNARHITEAHADELLSDVGRTADALESLARQIEAATTAEELRGLIEQLDDFQIKNVLVPKTHQVIASDALVAGAGALERYSEKLATIVSRFEEAGFDVTEAWRLLDEMDSHISEGYRLANPVAGAVIGLQAADWPDPAQSILGAARADLRAAGQNLKSAHGNASDIVSFLRGLTDGTDVDFGATDQNSSNQANDG